jgi:hypothetical protein
MEQKPPNGSIPPCLNGTTHAGLAVDYAISLLLAAYTTTAATGPMPPSWLQGVRKLTTLPPAPPRPLPLRPRPGPLAHGRGAVAEATRAEGLRPAEQCGSLPGTRRPSTKWSLLAIIVPPIRVSTPEQKCIGLPEQKYISDGGKKAPELGPLRNVRLGWDYPSACPGWPGVSGACSD